VRIETVRVWEGDPLPPLGEVDGLVAMGGPMSVNDVAEHAWIEPEVELLSGALDAELPVLGVCLGAQLVARALGLEVGPAAREEIGSGEVELTDAGRADPLLGSCGEGLVAFHWHGETFDVPAGRNSLARTPDCPNQAFRAGERAWALQFHPELDAGLAAGWRPLLPAGVEVTADELSAIAGGGVPLLGRFFELALGK
jgi:GMP synthase (glutamine-hydrolysing)